MGRYEEMTANKRNKTATVQLKMSSWANIMDSLYTPDTLIDSKSNFWAAIQNIDSQLGWEECSQEYKS